MSLTSLQGVQSYTKTYNAGASKSTTNDLTPSIFPAAVNSTQPAQTTAATAKKDGPYPEIVGSDVFKSKMKNAIDLIINDKNVPQNIKDKIKSIPLVEDSNPNNVAAAYNIGDKKTYVNKGISDQYELAGTIIHETTHAIQDEHPNFLGQNIPTIDNEAEAYFNELKYYVDARKSGNNLVSGEGHVYMFLPEYDKYMQEHPNATDKDIKDMIFKSVRSWDAGGYQGDASHNNFFSILQCVVNLKNGKDCRDLP